MADGNKMEYTDDDLEGLTIIRDGKRIAVKDLVDNKVEKEDGEGTSEQAQE